MRPSLLFPRATVDLITPPVIHGYVQSAATVAFNTFPLKNRLSDIANLHYVDGPPMYRNAPQSSSRPWWILDSDLEHNVKAPGRWNDCVHFHPITALWHTTTVLIKWSGKMVVRWVVKEPVRWNHRFVARCSNDSIASFHGKHQAPTSMHKHVSWNVTETIRFLPVAQWSQKGTWLPSRKDTAHQIRDTLLRCVQTPLDAFAQSFTLRSTCRLHI